MDVLVIIPARGGSKGIPRKNLRTLAGKPLISYSIQNALHSTFKPDVFVSSDDNEILFTAKKLGAQIIKRNPVLADDKTTLDPVIFDAYEEARKVTGKDYSLIVTLQPTSPLLKSGALDEALKQMQEDPAIDTIISAVNDTHLTWGQTSGGEFKPNYEKRVNRQYLPPVYKETGGFLITRNTVISPEARIGKNVSLHILPDSQAIDIDSFSDWNLCEYFLTRKKLVFVVTGYNEVGMGHVYNTLGLANEILEHEIVFLADSKSDLAFNKISENNYTVVQQSHENIIEDIKALSPDLVINDCLNTSEAYIKGLKDLGLPVINFEDLGPGARHADVVINAMYPEKEIVPNHYFGHDYFCLKNEFYLSQPATIRETVKQVLLSFGGVDPNNYTLKVLESIYDYCTGENINIKVILGMGYRADMNRLAEFPGISIVKDVHNMSEYIAEADVIFTSAGRTTFEIASIGVPAIVLAQNERETTHFFASQEYGFVNLGLGYQVSNSDLLEIFKDLKNNFQMRQYMQELMLKINIKAGKQRVVNIIKNQLNKI